MDFLDDLDDLISTLSKVAVIIFGRHMQDELGAVVCHALGDGLDCRQLDLALNGYAVLTSLTLLLHVEHHLVGDHDVPLLPHVQPIVFHHLP